ncbi:MAG: acyl carrier protein [Lachnospiraceae bacterium]|jgi:acyl carrier protein|nr:acyl carrier protein [Lachnospiraceae bacterium]MBQ3902053.1 acyl carrier protein [Lachnospiraceae bacterium]MCR5212372.1 acyl carrier protein [Lachnospiraceae bacterium]
MREKLLEILNNVNDGVEYEEETSLIDDHLIDSFGLITIVAEIEAEFDVKITPTDMLPENFNSVDAMLQMIERKKA